MKKRFRANIKGVVQGVGFRWFVRREAQMRNIAGYVMNLPDGTVEVDAQGEPQKIEDFLQELKRGPSMAIVSGVEIEWLPPTVYIDFRIKF